MHNGALNICFRINICELGVHLPSNVSTSFFNAGICLMIKLHRNSGVTLSYPCITLLRVFTIALAFGSLKSGLALNILFIASPMISTLRSTALCRRISC